MSFNRILVPFDGSDAGRAALETALLTAQPFGGHVDALYVLDTAERLAQLAQPVFGGEGMQALVEAAEAESHEQSIAAEAAYHKLVADLGLTERSEPSDGASIAWERIEGATTYAVAERGAVHDLTVVARSGAREVAEAALFETGRPALVAPATAPQTLGKKIVIGWNRSAQSARAVAAALPLIVRADAVMVFSVRTGAKRGASPEAVADYLAWHGVTAEVQEVEPDYRVIGEALLEEANGFEADLIVMGAFSHNRLRELILGGVTTYVLNSAELPVLMAL